MRKLLYFLVAVFTITALTSCVIDVESEPDFSIKEKSRDLVYFLHSPTCGYSNAAKKYVNETYPNATIVFIDIDNEGNKEYLKAAKYDYDLGSDIPTPIICFGVNHIAGWDFYKREALDAYIQDYLH